MSLCLYFSFFFAKKKYRIYIFIYIEYRDFNSTFQHRTTLTLVIIGLRL